MNNTANPNQTLYEITQACVYYQEGPPKLTKIMSIYSFYELQLEFFFSKNKQTKKTAFNA